MADEAPTQDEDTPPTDMTHTYRTSHWTWAAGLLALTTVVWLLVKSAVVLQQVRAATGVDYGGAMRSVGAITGVLLLAGVAQVVCAKRDVRQPWPVLGASVLGALLLIFGTSMFLSDVTRWGAITLSALILIADALDVAQSRGHTAPQLDILALPAGILAIAVGFLGIHLASNAVWANPQIPDAVKKVTFGHKDAQTLVTIKFTYSSGDGADLTSAAAEELRPLLRAGTAQITYVPTEYKQLAGDLATSEAAAACAYDAAGDAGARRYLAARGRGLLKHTGGTIGEKELHQWGKNAHLGGTYRKCVDSDKYLVGARHDLEERGTTTKASMPHISINGQHVKPKSVDALVKQIKKAAK